MNETYINSHAIIEDNVTIGKGVRIWHHCHVREKSVIEDEVSLGKSVYIDHGVVIAKGARIQNGVSIYKGVDVGEWVFVGPNVTFTNDRFPRAGTTNWKPSRTTLEAGSSVGAGSVIVCEITIGAFAMIGAASVVTKSVPPFHLAYGIPAKIISKICACGETRIEEENKSSELILPCCHKKLKLEVILLAEKYLDHNKL